MSHVVWRLSKHFPFKYALWWHVYSSKKYHCAKNVQIRSFFRCTYFLVFSPNTRIYGPEKKSVFGLCSRSVLLLVNLINTEDSNWHVEFEHKLSNETFWKQKKPSRVRGYSKPFQTSMMHPYKHTTCIQRRFKVEYKCVCKDFFCRNSKRLWTESTHFFLLECQDTPCSKQARYLKFKWLQLGWDPKTFIS